MVDGGEALQWTMEEAYRIIETLTGVWMDFVSEIRKFGNMFFKWKLQKM